MNLDMAVTGICGRCKREFPVARLARLPLASQIAAWMFSRGLLDPDRAAYCPRCYSRLLACYLFLSVLLGAAIAFGVFKWMF